MKYYKISVPVTGMLTLPIGAESIEEAIEILPKKQEALERHSCGHLNLELDKIIVIPEDPKIFN